VCYRTEYVLQLLVEVTLPCLSGFEIRAVNGTLGRVQVLPSGANYGLFNMLENMAALGAP
jgi:hypothetical protein